MSTTCEVTPIEELDLTSCVPCGFLRPYPKECGNPSIARVRMSCTGCMGNFISFACSVCLSILIQGRSRCGGCLVRSNGMNVPQIQYIGET